ncbi:glycosyltransferase [Bacteroidota bacterium]
MIYQLLEILFFIFIAFLAIQLAYYWVLFSRMAFYKHPEGSKEKPPVSIIISACNEYYNLEENLPVLFNQDYPEFEVVVVNDASDDESSELLQDMRKHHPELKIVNIPQRLNFFSGKKFPLSIGIKSAKYETILLTDADCHPKSRKWIETMVSGYLEGKDIVIGYGAYIKKKGLLNKLVRYETLHVALQYISLAIAGKPYMAVGRNLSYKRKLFYDSKGFISHYKVKSGDDDLFISQVANKKNVCVQINPLTHTLSVPPQNFAAYIRQKRRHYTTSKYYKMNIKFILGMYYLSQSGFWISFIILIIFDYKLLSLLILFGIRVLSQLIIVKKAQVKLEEEGLFLISPLLDFLVTFLNPLLAFSNLFYRKNKWK